MIQSVSFQQEQKKQRKKREKKQPERVAVEEEISPEAMEANEYFDQLRARKMELEIKGDLTGGEQEELELLNEQVEAADDLGEIVERIDK